MLATYSPSESWIDEEEGESSLQLEEIREKRGETRGSFRDCGMKGDWEGINQVVDCYWSCISLYHLVWKKVWEVVFPQLICMAALYTV